MSTNIGVTMLTLNEADRIESTLHDVEPIMDELVIIDGGSDDGTVGIARNFAEERDMHFHCVESSEREYLLEGPGTQRRRAEDWLWKVDYSLSIDADISIDLGPTEWYERDFKHKAYTITREWPSGRVGSEPRLYRLGSDYRWRGIIHEEIRNRKGKHLAEKMIAPDCPLTMYHNRDEAMATHSVVPGYERAHDPRAGGNMGSALRKQHYLLHRAITGTEHLQWMVPEPYKKYYWDNQRLVVGDWWEVLEEYDLPQHAPDLRDTAENRMDYDGYDLTTDESVMSPYDRTVSDVIAEKISDICHTPKTSSTYSTLITRRP